MQAQEAAADATPPSSVTDPAAGAITPPVTDPKASVQPDPNAQKGPIPFAVHETALRNAREKAVAEYRQQHGWAADVPQRLAKSGISEQEFTTWVNDARAMSADPVTFFTTKFTELQNHPVYGPQIRSTAGRTLAGGGNAMPEPDVQIVDAQGQPTGKLTYSHEQQALKDQWLRTQMTGEFQQMLQPLVADRETRLQQERDAKTQQEIKTAADRVIGKIDRVLDLGKATEDRKKELYAAVNTVMAANPGMDAEDAAWQVREQQILPAADATAQAKALETQKQKAAANTASGSATAPTTERPKTEKELSTWMQAHPEA